MRFELLGPLRVQAGGHEVPVTARRERVLLALLVLHANRTVPLPELVEAVWDRRPPKDARSQLQGCVSRLRRRLAGAGAGREVIATDPAGYRLQVHPDAVDVCELRRLRDQARAAAAGGREVEAGRRYRTALALWRGPACGGVDSDPVRDAAASLEEERVLLLEECVRLELELGRAGELVGELSGLVQQHPYREGLHAALMLALYRAGRPADALATYRHAHRLLRDELGAEPGEELQRLHRAVLNRDPELAGPGPAARPPAGPAHPPPRELPHEAAGFTGRLAALKALDELLPDQPDGGPAPVPIAVVTGPAGVGKTALAIYWAHRVADRFPDGQLHLDLRGYDPAGPVPAGAALAALLRSLGCPPDRVPTDPAGAAAQFRSPLAGRRVVVVLDNAGSVEQVRPLVPGSAGCFVLVTSRDRLTGLAARDGATRLVLDPLAPGEAWTMLAGRLGPARAEAERDAVAELATLCGNLPLALRIAAANLADQPDRTISGYAAELATGDRLTALRAEGDEPGAVRAAFDLSYRVLPAAARQLFRRLGLLPGPDFSAPVAAALAGVPTAEAERLLRTLTAVHLVEEHSPGRYAGHDLLRRYAAQLVEAEEAGPDRTAAVTRLLAGYLGAADAAARLLHPQLVRLPRPVPAGPSLAGFERTADAVAWLDTERPNLVAAVAYAADRPGLAELAGLLADRLRGYFLHRLHTLDWLRTARSAAAAADRAGDLLGQAAAALSLAQAHQNLSRYPEAITHYTTAHELAGRAGWRRGQAACLTNLGNVHQVLGDIDRSADHHARSLAINQREENLAGQAVNRLNLAELDCLRGRLPDGVAHLTAALELNRRLGYPRGQAGAGTSLGFTYRAMGQLDRALALFTEALPQFRAIGDRGGEASALHGLAAAHHDAGRQAVAGEYAERAATLAAETGDRDREAHALRTLGNVQLALGRPARALAHHRAAVELARRARSRLAETSGLVCLAESTHRSGDAAAAARLAGEALAQARACGYRVFEAEALVVLAEIQLDRGDHPAAREHADLGLALHRETGCRPGEQRALRLLARLDDASPPQAPGRA